MSDDFQWQDPPARNAVSAKAQEVAEQLRSRPNMWARIAYVEGIEFFPWYGAFFRNPDFETRLVPRRSSSGIPLFAGPRDIYARFVDASAAPSDATVADLIGDANARLNDNLNRRDD